jgi:hypothetical protein
MEMPCPVWPQGPWSPLGYQVVEVTDEQVPVTEAGPQPGRPSLQRETFPPPRRPPRSLGPLGPEIVGRARNEIRAGREFNPPRCENPCCWPFLTPSVPFCPSGPDRTRTCNQGIMRPTSAFAARRAPVRGLDCAFTVDATSLGASVSSLYTFPASRAWLGVGMGGQGESSPVAFADFTEVLRHDFSGRDPVGGWQRAGRARSVSSARTPPLPSPLLCR